MRDVLVFSKLPTPPRIDIHFDASNAGPLYFLLVLTAGIIIPALRRNRILDIKTLEEDPGAAQVGAVGRRRRQGPLGLGFRVSLLRIFGSLATAMCFALSGIVPSA